MQPEPPDDLDRLYARLAWDDPRPNFTGRVLARVRRLHRVRRISAVATLVALSAVGVFAFALGRDLTLSGGLDFLVALATNLDLAAEAADQFALALVDVLPWLEVAAVALSLAGVWLAAYALPRLLAGRVEVK